VSQAGTAAALPLQHHHQQQNMQLVIDQPLVPTTDNNSRPLDGLDDILVAVPNDGALTSITSVSGAHLLAAAQGSAALHATSPHPMDQDGAINGGESG
jgi:hypothetical protein